MLTGIIELLSIVNRLNSRGGGGHVEGVGFYGKEDH